MKKLICTLIALSFLLSGCAISGQPSKGMSAEAPAIQSGDASTAPTLPDITVYDVQGNPYSLSEFRGKPVVLNFWASWCGPCKREMPELQAAYEAYGDQIHFLMVDLAGGGSDTVEAATAFLATTDYTFPVYFDTTGEAAYLYSVSSIQVTYFIDAQGRGVTYYPGAMSQEILDIGLGMLLEE